DIGRPIVGAVVILQTFNPTPGSPPWSGSVRYTIRGLDNFRVGHGASWTPLGFPSPASNLINAQEGYYNATALTGLEVTTQYMGGGAKTLGQTVVGSPEEPLYYPFFSQKLEMYESVFDFN